MQCQCSLTPQGTVTDVGAMPAPENASFDQRDRDDLGYYVTILTSEHPKNENIRVDKEHEFQTEYLYFGVQVQLRPKKGIKK